MPLEPSPLTPFKTADQVVKEAEQKARDLTAKAREGEPVLQNLVAHIRDRWQLAQNAKATRIEPRLLKCKRAVRQEYEAGKLKAIQELYGKEFDPPYPPIIATKRRDLVAWLRDFLLRPDVDIFDIEPTPLPELPGDMNQQIKILAEQQAFKMLFDQAFQNNQIMDKESVMEQAAQIVPLIKDHAMSQILKKAKDAVERMQQKIDDQFQEGDFDVALKEVISDIGMYPNAFIEGPIQQKVLVQKMVYDTKTGKWKSETQSEVISKFERFSPMDAYPQPDAKGIKDGYFFRKIRLTPKSLSDCLGVKGYSDANIREVLKAFRSGGLIEWTNIEAARARLEDRDTVASYDTDKIDCLKFWGTASGRMLTEWAGSSEKARELYERDLDPEKEYQIIAWVISNYVIKAMLNPDPLGQKNVFMATFDDDPDNFWSPTSLPESLWDVQTSCNAIARATVLTVGFASGPQIEYDKDRFPDGVSPSFYPLKQWASTGGQMTAGKPINFWQPELLTEPLRLIYEFYRSLADEYSGIPRYMQGEKKGSSPTASGFSMQISQQSRGLKSILMNLDYGIIEPAVRAQYNFNLEYEEDVDMVGDCKITAKGSSSVIAKEQLAIRRREILGEVVGSPILTQIVGMNGIKELFKASVQPVDIDLDRIFKEEELLNEMSKNTPPPQPLPGQQPPQANQGTPERPMGVNPAGDKASGGDFLLHQTPEGNSPQ
jgi:hypothetical protein